MGLLASFTTKNPGDTITAALWNSNFSAIVTWAGSYVVHTDVAKTITVTHIYTQTQTFTGGWTAGAGCFITVGGLDVSGGFQVTTGNTAITTLTCTTIDATGLISGEDSTFSGTIHTLISGVEGRFYSNSLGTVRMGAWSDHPLEIIQNGLTRITVNTSGQTVATYVVASTGITVTTGGITVSAGGAAITGNSTVTGTLAVSSTINGQTISATASFSGSLTVANGFTVSAGTSAMAAVTCTTLATSSNATVGGTLGVTGAMTTSTINGQTISSTANFTGTVAIAGALSGAGASFTGAVQVGANTALAASATSGFFWFNSTNGAPIGSPTEFGDRVAITYNYSGNRLYIYNPTDDTWRSVALT